MVRYSLMASKGQMLGWGDIEITSSISSGLLAFDELSVIISLLFAGRTLFAVMVCLAYVVSVYSETRSIP